MSKHTAGPWRVAVGFPAVESDTAPNLALCNDQSVPMTERMANARLIAAAPELHAENERLRAEIERLRVVHRETLADVMKRMRAECDALRALLIRIRSWDHLRWASDGPFWIREIDAALAAREAK